MQYFSRLAEGFCARPIWKREKTQIDLLYFLGLSWRCELLNLPQLAGAAVGTGHSSEVWVMTTHQNAHFKGST